MERADLRGWRLGEDLALLARELWVPERLSAAGIGPDEGRFEEALRALAPAEVIR